jgi:hypothetical protein
MKNKKNISTKVFNYEPELTSKLDNFAKDDQFTRSTFDEITLWKVSRYPNITKEIIEAVNELAHYDTLDAAIYSLKSTLSLLLKTKGVRLAMASTYLRFRNPQVFQIIDQRVYRQVQHWKGCAEVELRVPHKIEDQIDLYIQYLRDLRIMCEATGVDFFIADRIFYMEDKIDGNRVKY